MNGLSMSSEQIRRFYKIYNYNKIIEYYESRKLVPAQYNSML